MILTSLSVLILANVLGRADIPMIGYDHPYLVGYAVVKAGEAPTLRYLGQSYTLKRFLNPTPGALGQAVIGKRENYEVAARPDLASSLQMPSQSGEYEVLIGPIFDQSGASFEKTFRPIVKTPVYENGGGVSYGAVLWLQASRTGSVGGKPSQITKSSFYNSRFGMEALTTQSMSEILTNLDYKDQVSLTRAITILANSGVHFNLVGNDASSAGASCLSTLLRKNIPTSAGSSKALLLGGLSRLGDSDAGVQALIPFLKEIVKNPEYWAQYDAGRAIRFCGTKPGPVFKLTENSPTWCAQALTLTAKVHDHAIQERALAILSSSHPVQDQKSYLELLDEVPSN